MNPCDTSSLWRGLFFTVSLVFVNGWVLLEKDTNRLICMLTVHNSIILTAGTLLSPHGFSIKFRTGRLRSEVQTVTLL